MPFVSNVNGTNREVGYKNLINQLHRKGKQNSIYNAHESMYGPRQNC
jgi:hypothetical protein